MTCAANVCSYFHDFWREHPALLYGLAMLLGSLAALAPHPALLFPGVVIFFPLIPAFFAGHTLLAARLFFALLLGVGAMLMACVQCSFPDIPEEGIQGTAYINIESLSSQRTHFGSFWVYKGTLDGIGGLSDFKGLPVKISIPKRHEERRPSAGGAYLIRGRLKTRTYGAYLFMPSKHVSWTSVNGSWSLAEWRWEAKQFVKQYIRSSIADSRSAVFLGGIATGEFDDRAMSSELGRFGLQHIMAISGFHFSILAGALGVLFRFVFPGRKAHMLILFLLSGYFVFLGASPSILRAWIAIFVALMGGVLGRSGNGLNSLGVALIAALLVDPAMSLGKGFQFSFGVTGAILLLFSGSDQVCQWIVEKRRLSEVANMNSINQHGYLVLAAFRQALALGIAVNAVALPLALYHFHKFPLLGLLYNLFFPFLVSISMLLLILGILAPFGSVIHQMNSYYTRFVLDFAYNMPSSLDTSLYVESYSPWILAIHLSVVFLIGMWGRMYLRRSALQGYM